MEIYIVRHGDAIDFNHPSVTSDEMRPLTDRGHEEVALMARLLARLGVAPDLILTSPLVRARQTAEIIADITASKVQPAISDELAPGGALAGVMNDILSHGRPTQTVLTGHMPGVAQLTGYLVWRDDSMAKRFRTAEVCRIDLADDNPVPGTGDLRWAIPPRIAERLIGS